MDAAQLAALRRPRSFPAVSVVLPTHRTRPENQQDKLRLKTLMDEARVRLGELDLKRGGAEEILQNLEKAAGQVDFSRVAEGLVLLAAPDGESHAFVLPDVQVRERVVIDDTFATRDLVAMLESTWHYWVLVLSEQPTRLWSGDGETVTEVANALFPLEFADSLPDERGPAPTQRKQFRIQDDRRMQFFRQVVRNLAAMLEQDPRPVVVFGVPRYLTYLRDLADRTVADAMIGSVEGSFDSATPAEVARLARPVLHEEHDRQRQAAVAELDEARSARRYAAGMQEVTHLAATGRIAHLLVEDDYFDPNPADDAVDDLIETVLSADGRVTFVPNDSLPDRIAAVLRY